MKSNILKYIFIVFVIGIIGFAAYKIYYNEEEQVQNETTNEINTQSTMLTNIRIGISNFDNINPLISKNRDVINLSSVLYEPLCTLTSDYHLKLALAKEYSKIDDTTYIVKLRDDIKWDNGNKITGQDVKFTIEKLKEGKSIYSGNVQNIDSVEIIDGQTIRLNLSEAEPFFEYNLIFPIISSSQFEKEEDFYNSRIAPVSSGMYKVKNATTTTMDLELNTNWYGLAEETPRIKDIQIHFYSTMGDVYSSFKLGNIDMVCTSNMDIKNYIGTIGYTEKDYKGRELDFLSINSTNSILSDKSIRKALNYAINKKKIVSSVYGSNYTISNFPLDYGSYLYTKSSDKDSYSQEKAKKALEDGGWTYRYGRWQKTENYSTKTLRLNIVVDSSNKQRVKVAELIEKQLEDIGIRISIYKVSNKNYKDYLNERNYDLILTGINNGYSPDLTYFLGDGNIGNYENEEIKSIMSELQNTTDEETIKQKYQKIIEIYEEDTPYICLYRNRGKTVYSMKLFGEFNPNNYTIFLNGIDSKIL